MHYVSTFLITRRLVSYDTAMVLFSTGTREEGVKSNKLQNIRQRRTEYSCDQSDAFFGKGILSGPLTIQKS